MLNSSLDDTADVLSSNTSMLGCISPAGNKNVPLSEDSQMKSISPDTNISGCKIIPNPPLVVGSDCLPPEPPLEEQLHEDTSGKTSRFRARLLARKLASEARSSTPPSNEIDGLQSSEFKSPDSIPSPKRSLVLDIGPHRDDEDIVNDDGCKEDIDDDDDDELLQHSPAHMHPTEDQTTPLVSTNTTRHSLTSQSTSSSMSSSPINASPLTALIALHTLEMSRGNQDKWPLHALHLDNEGKNDVEVEEIQEGNEVLGDGEKEVVEEEEKEGHIEGEVEELKGEAEGEVHEEVSEGVILEKEEEKKLEGDEAGACDEKNMGSVEDIDSSDRIVIKHPSLTNIPIPRRPSLVDKRPSIAASGHIYVYLS
jgi:hypothetical protein